MSVDVDHPVVAAYLAQLDAAAAAAGLTGGRRAELRAEIRAHVLDALGPGPDPSDAAIADVLDRLGPVEEIVGAEPTPAPGMSMPMAPRPYVLPPDAGPGGRRRGRPAAFYVGVVGVLVIGLLFLLTVLGGLFFLARGSSSGPVEIQAPVPATASPAPMPPSVQETPPRTTIGPSAS
jgi:hypothetical protein